MKSNPMPDHFREVVSLAIVALFAFAYVRNPTDEMMKTALVAALGVVTGYWLGGSVKTGDKPQPVTVTNTSDAPVPVEAS